MSRSDLTRYLVTFATVLSAGTAVLLPAMTFADAAANPVTSIVAADDSATPPPTTTTPGSAQPDGHGWIG